MMTLDDLTKDPQLLPLAAALLNNGVARLRIPSARYFEYELHGEDLVAHAEDIAKVIEAFRHETGLTDLKAVPKVLPGLEAQETLVLPDGARASVAGRLIKLLVDDLEQDQLHIGESPMALPPRPQRSGER